MRGLLTNREAAPAVLHELYKKTYFLLFFFKCRCECTPSFFFFFSVSASADAKKKSNLITIATWRGEVRQALPQGHFGYSKHGQGNGAVAEMDDNKDGRGDQWVGIGYTASSRCTTNQLVG